MCGVIGLAGRIGGADAACPTRFDAARDTMASRGPDGAASETAATPVGLLRFGHRRLAILDLSAAGRQPMRSSCGRCLITYNGEIYNADALRAELVALGRPFRSRCDTEVLVNGYAEWGPAVLGRLRGMFAFAIWDEVARTVFLARDRVGMKPLYVAQDAGGLAFASDLRALKALGLGSEPDPEALALYLVFGYVPSPWSMGRGIRKLAPGCCMTWRPGVGAETTRWWTPPEASAAAAPDPDDVEALIDAAVSEHLMSDVPVGVFLSGGLDSSLVASSAARAAGDPAARPQALTIASPGARDDEAGIARSTAEFLGLGWESMAIGQHDAAGALDAACAALDEPMAYSAVITQTAVSALAARRFKVMLSGDGGDEAFGGYRWYERLDEAFAPPRRPGMFRRPKPKALLDLFAARSSRHRNLRRVADAFTPEQAADLVEGVAPARVAEMVDALLDSCDAPGLPLKRRLQRIDLMTFCADCICAKVDRAGMAHGLEVRPPLLDHRILEMGLAAPLDPGMDARPKAVLRTILARRGLGRLLDEPKRGFSLKGDQAFELEGARRRSDPGLVADWQAMLRRPRGMSRGQIRALAYLGRWLDAAGSPGA
ncbi:MAG: asparagine synthase (glutamine-hydrolyzing) [Rubrimonas sp.]